MVNFYSKKKIYYNPQLNTLLVVNRVGNMWKYRHGISVHTYAVSPEFLGYELVGEL